MGHIKRAKALRAFIPKEPAIRNRSISTISSSRYSPRLVSKPPSPLSSLIDQDKFIREWVTGQLHLLGWSSETLATLLEAKKPSLWGKLKTHMRVGTLKPPVDSSLLPPTFGVPLETLSSHPLTYIRSFPLPGLKAAFDPRSKVPNCVQQCILAMLSKDLSIEGIFRKNGNIRQLKIMHDAIDARQDTDSTFYTNESPVQLAALLKRFLRELPEPLMTHRLYSLFMSSLRMKTPKDTQTVLHLACCLLPKPNRDLLFLLLALLSWTTTFKALNRMDSYNLACVVAPNILYYTSKDLNSTLQSYSQEDEIQVVRLLIEHQDQLCMVNIFFYIYIYVMLIIIFRFLMI
ncbi:Rho GTPase activation protein [Phycomyces blakesleeanus]|uniref:Rho GTPase activation protein n=1 Tax=Phycomyces blakesleeanus TaxID=4837 RepID=A0ABR3AZJ0_PHYBL